MFHRSLKKEILRFCGVAISSLNFQDHLLSKSCTVAFQPILVLKARSQTAVDTGIQ